ncbi:anthranilate phosphoribosyltransferase [Nitrosomonas sp.]|uniref:anthranilate phosphoribosyltransferase n=1 Tax=Nitrosomonas sp. TaxID=42353 RepID=UPI0025F88D99|nr:anthranilate phosphoribosyltransferase [Nitrosomonas sp.]MCC6917393.1 anthranilate phosphoribosyltransferase [Nitrosomonas sp.]
MNPQIILARILEQREIPYEEMVELMRAIMSGNVSPIMTAALVAGLRMKRESISEISAAAQVMRELAVRIEVADSGHLVDTCGTGGDGRSTFNISTASAFVTAAAGVQVAKHGGRSVSSKVGSADVLEAIGINLNQTPDQIAQSITEVGIGFMFAPNFHHAMKHAAPVRRELGVRTIFNILGPLTNPAGAKNQLLGVFNPDLTSVLAQVLLRLGSRHAMIVHGSDGLDEITISGPTRIAELNAGKIREYSVQPEDFDLERADIASLQVDSTEEARNMLLSVLDNRSGPARDIVLLNAGAAIYVAGKADSWIQGVKIARDMLISGAAKQKMQALIEFSNRLTD